MEPIEADKRRDKRLALALPVKFSKSPQTFPAPLEGVTHNVSPGGLYFETPVGQLTTSESLWVRIAVPAHHGDDKPNVTLVSSGVVRRVEPLPSERIIGAWPELQLQQGIYGIAVRFQQRPMVQLQSFEELLWEDQPQA